MAMQSLFVALPTMSTEPHTVAPAVVLPFQTDLSCGPAPQAASDVHDGSDVPPSTTEGGYISEGHRK